MSSAVIAQAGSSQIFEIKGDRLSELSKLVKRVGDQQKELILDISKQLSRHNEIIDRAVEKQARMDAKIDDIEDLLMKKASLNYKRKLEKLDQEHKERQAAKAAAAAQKVYKGAQLAPVTK